jgi:hypothetical protein
MEHSGTNAAVTYQWPGFECNKQFTHRNEVIDRLSRTPVKVRHWLLSNDIFQAGLESLNPSSPAWIKEDKVRSLVMNGLVRMIDSANDFVVAFPEAQIPKV